MAKRVAVCGGGGGGGVAWETAGALLQNASGIFGTFKCSTHKIKNLSKNVIA